MRILKITSPDICNGLGNRVTLWVAGCSHHCEGCHNKFSWDYNIGLDISIKANYDKIFNIICTELDREIIQGLTLAGGDPLSQPDDRLHVLLNLLTEIKAKYPTKDIWIYNGEYYEETIKNSLKKEIIDLCDVMIDGPFELAKRNTTIAFRGSSNQRIIDLKKTTPNNIVKLID